MQHSAVRKWMYYVETKVKSMNRYQSIIDMTIKKETELTDAYLFTIETPQRITLEADDSLGFPCPH